MNNDKKLIASADVYEGNGHGTYSIYESDVGDKFGPYYDLKVSVCHFGVIAETTVNLPSKALIQWFAESFRRIAERMPDEANPEAGWHDATTSLPYENKG